LFPRRRSETFIRQPKFRFAQRAVVSKSAKVSFPEPRHAGNPLGFSGILFFSCTYGKLALATSAALKYFLVSSQVDGQPSIGCFLTRRDTISALVHGQRS